VTDILRTTADAALRVYSNTDGQAPKLLPVTSLTVTYAVNEIPQASVQIGLGADVHLAGLPLVVDKTALDMLLENNTVQLLIKLTGDRETDTPWPDTAQVLFEGKISNVSEQITRGAAALTVSLTHWLKDLQSSNLFYDAANPQDVRFAGQSPAVFYNSTGVSLPDVLAGTQNRGSIGELVEAYDLVGKGLSDDVWGKGIRELMVRLADMPLRPVLSLEQRCDQVINQIEDKVIRALARLQGISSKFATPLTSGAVPLVLRNSNGQAYSQPIVQAIANEIAGAPIAQYAQMDIWSRLVGYYAPTFHAMIIPRPLDAMFVPQCLSQRPSYDISINSQDILQLDSVEPLSTPIKAVGLLGKHGLLWGADLNFNSPGTLNYAACYTAPGDLRTNGKTVFSNPPSYLRGLALISSQENSVTTGQSVAGGAANPKQTVTPPPANYVTDTRDILKRFAQDLYHYRRLHGRTTKVVGKLRFDIGPGSMVRVSARQDQLRPESEQFKGVGRILSEFQGMVTRMTIAINVQQKLAATSFQLSGVRTVAENADESITAERHPIYNDLFLGCPLIDDYSHLSPNNQP
jgi:hypothetical protein